MAARGRERAAPALRPAQALRPAHNVVFILVDTLRADHLPLYGYGRDTSPNLTALGRESLVFQAARSQASCTFPSVNSMLTSRSASAFLGQPGGAMGLPAGIPGLAELLHARGFHTAAVSASPIVRASPGRFNPGGGYGRGFDSFQEDCVWQGADCVTGQALPHLGRDPRPLFLYLHYLDPHGPYAPPAGYRPRFARGRPDKDFVRRGDPNPIARWLYQGGADPRVTAADLAYLVDLYDDKIAFFDAQLGRLVAALRAGGLLDDTLLVLAADHGEEFLEHGDVKHCRNLFDTTIRTPLLLRVPGARPRAVAEPVENLDIVPTLLDLLGTAAGQAAGPTRPPASRGAACGRRRKGGRCRRACSGPPRVRCAASPTAASSWCGTSPPAVSPCTTWRTIRGRGATWRASGGAISIACARRSTRGWRAPKVGWPATPCGAPRKAPGACARSATSTEGPRALPVTRRGRRAPR